MTSRNSNKTKKEHYVPRCYLNRWGNEKKQIRVFDKMNNKNWQGNVEDNACERFFYDIKPADLSVENMIFLHSCGIIPEKDEQFIEHFFSEQIETEYANLLQKIVDGEITLWKEKNCYFISEKNKLLMAVCLAYQYIRTKQVREMINGISHCIEQWMKEMNCIEGLEDKYLLHPGDENIIQGNMICNYNHVTELTKRLFNLTWILRIDKTEKLLYTSDSPIGTYPHKFNEHISMSGIGSEGIEVFIPLSPKLLLVMYDGDYHTELKKLDRKYFEITSEEDIDTYNLLCLSNSNQYIYSADGDLDLVHALSTEDLKRINMPKVQLSYGGKRYFPM